MEPDDLTDFDPYEVLMRTQDLLEQLALSHNQLVEDYTNTLNRIKMLEKQLMQIQIKKIKQEGI